MIRVTHPKCFTNPLNECIVMDVSFCYGMATCWLLAGDVKKVAMLRAYGGVSGWSMRVKRICVSDYIKELMEASPCGSIEGR